ncbi:hypothetical protein G6514_008245 [Epicoccum nigrum]|nr:hypothetical protein G6514_008245 [Epicoccum nigrum]
MPSLNFLNLPSTLLSALHAPHALQETQPTRQLSSTGPYTPLITTYALLPHHTLYQPSHLSTLYGPTPNETVPVVIWANSVCNAKTNNDPYAALNAELASWGMLVLACGPAGAALDVVEAQAGQGAWESVDKGRLGMVGTSCGGKGVYAAAQDKRVLSLAVLEAEDGKGGADAGALAARMTQPVFYFHASEAATEVGVLDSGTSGTRRDFEAVAKGIPAWYGALPGTDVQTLSEGSAEKLGRAVRFWAQWMVGGEQEGKEFFLEASGAESEGWTVVRKGMDVLKV